MQLFLQFISTIIFAFFLVSCGKKTADPKLLEKIRSEGIRYYLDKGFSSPLYSEPNIDTSPSAEMFFDSKFKGIMTDIPSHGKWVQLATDTDQVGWLPLDKLRTKYSEKNSIRYAVFADSLNVYAVKNTNSKVLGTKKFGEDGFFYSEDYYYSKRRPEWMKIQYQGKEAYIQYAEQNISLNEELAVVYVDSAEVRDFPNPRGKVIGNLKYGNLVSFLKIVNETEMDVPPRLEKDDFLASIKPTQWLAVNLYGGRGFLAPNSTKSFVSMKSFTVSAPSITVHAKPSQNSKQLGSMENGSTFTSWDESAEYDTIDGISAKWVSTEYELKKAWVFAGYLQEDDDSSINSESKDSESGRDYED